MNNSDHPLYRKWWGMICRCKYPSTGNYKYYGGRGIKVCDAWIKDFKNFYDFANANGWMPGLTIDRINPDGDYEPENCRFITAEENIGRANRKDKASIIKVQNLLNCNLPISKIAAMIPCARSSIYKWLKDGLVKKRVVSSCNKTWCKDCDFFIDKKIRNTKLTSRVSAKGQCSKSRL